MTGTGIATVGGCRIAYRRAGTDGPPVVLLHGAGIDDATVSWCHAIDALAETCQVYAPDWPEYGESIGSIEHTTERYVTVLDEFLETLPYDSVSLVGISMGGGAALGYALANPERVDRLALVNSYGLGARLPDGLLWKHLSQIPGAAEFGKIAASASDQTVRLVLNSLVADASELPQPFVDDVRAKLKTPRSLQAFKQFQDNELSYTGRVATNFVDDLASLAVPTMLIHGRQDPLVPIEWSIRAADRIPDAELKLIQDCGHWAPRERPRQFNDLLLEWLPDERITPRIEYPKAQMPGLESVGD